VRSSGLYVGLPAVGPPFAFNQVKMSRTANENLRRLKRLTNDMVALADDGDKNREDDSCGILYGILRDSAYRLRKLTEQECQKHREAGKWT